MCLYLSKGLFVFSSGGMLVIEDLSNGSQRIIEGITLIQKSIGQTSLSSPLL